MCQIVNGIFGGFFILISTLSQKATVILLHFAVALPAEGVGRNPFWSRVIRAEKVSVALPAEGVGRNLGISAQVSGFDVSPSPRRAWVEIWTYPPRSPALTCRPPRGGRG